MKRDKTYRYIESCMYNYYGNLNRVQELQRRLKTLMSVRGHNYEAHIVNSETDPVMEVTNTRLKIEERLKELEEYIRPVRNLYNDLKNVYTDKKQILSILKKKYFNHKPPGMILDELHISQPTYWRRNQELMKLAKQYFVFEE